MRETVWRVITVGLIEGHCFSSLGAVLGDRPAHVHVGGWVTPRPVLVIHVLYVPTTSTGEEGTQVGRGKKWRKRHEDGGRWPRLVNPAQGQESLLAVLSGCKP
jgi:hypothetical protein